MTFQEFIFEQKEKIILLSTINNYSHLFMKDNAVIGSDSGDILGIFFIRETDTISNLINLHSNFKKIIIYDFSIICETLAFYFNTNDKIEFYNVEDKVNFNLNNMTKIIMNPPYAGSLHLKILSKVIEECPNAEIVSLQPIRWLQDPLAEYKKAYVWKTYKNIINHIFNIEIISSRVAENLFNANMTQDLGIYYLNMQGGYKIKRNPIFEKIIFKIIQEDNILNHYVIDDLDGISCRVSHTNEIGSAHGADITKAALVLPKERSYFTNKKNDVSGETYYEISKRTAWGKIKPKNKIGNLKFNTIEERENFYNCMWTNFMRWFFVSQVVDLRNFLQFYPYLDWTHSWSDNDLYKYYNLTQKEIDIIEDEVKNKYKLI